MWDSFRCLFKGKVQGAQDGGQQIPDVPWIEAADNPWNVRLLDVRPVTQHMLSTSKNPLFATNAISFLQDDGTGFIGVPPASDRMIPAELRYNVDPCLVEGILFRPEAMEHKWAIFYHGGRILVIRSWLRQVQVVADVASANDYALIHSVRGTFTEDDEPPILRSV